MSRSILIDTHIWIWHLIGDASLSNRIRKLIDESALENEVNLCAISIWEIAMLVKKNKIKLNTSCYAWVKKALSLPGISLIPLSPEIAVESCELPGDFHGDPADRMIVASAKIENLAIVSKDEKLCRYCKQHGIDVIPA